MTGVRAEYPVPLTAPFAAISRDHELATDVGSGERVGLSRRAGNRGAVVPVLSHLSHW